jgi:hypothetical protein
MIEGSFPSVVVSSIQPESTLPDCGHDTSPSMALETSSADTSAEDHDERRRRATKVTEL